MSNEIADTIGKMREILIERGRIQHHLCNADGQVCLLGANAVARGMDPVWLDEEVSGYSHFTYDATVHFLAKRLGVGYLPPVVVSKHQYRLAVSQFNDITADDNTVLDFLHEAQLAAKESHA